ncbi:ribokinase [bacterium]|nr:MAG: ribokinase [bacterium]
MDLVFRTARIPAVGETVLGEGFATHPGGKGANQAVAIGRLGGRVSFAGCVGDDVFGDALRQSLRDATVDTEHLLGVKGPSGTAGILVDAEGRNLIVVAPGANSAVTESAVDEAIRTILPAVVLAQLEIPLVAIEAAAKAERFVLNPAPARPLPAELVARCYVLTPNETEIETLTGIAATDGDSCDAAARALLDQGAEYVVITLGSRGSYLASPKGGMHFPAPNVEAIDTTAAGDAFNGALVMFLAEGREIGNAVALANCVGALSTTRLGAQESMPNREELRNLAGNQY